MKRIIDAKFETFFGECTVTALLDDGSSSLLFSYYTDELSFNKRELIGKTVGEAKQLYHDKDIAYLRS